VDATSSGVRVNIGGDQRRVQLPQSVRRQIDVTTLPPPRPNGRLVPVDPNTRTPLRPGRIDIGHRPGEEWRRRRIIHAQQDSSRAAVIQAERNPSLYQFEDAASNRSHRFERK
jgi:HNH/ENDO VII superfamily nuclease with conserved GHE residues